MKTLSKDRHGVQAQRVVPDVLHFNFRKGLWSVIRIRAFTVARSAFYKYFKVTNYRVIKEITCEMKVPITVPIHTLAQQYGSIV